MEFPPAYTPVVHWDHSRMPHKPGYVTYGPPVVCVCTHKATSNTDWAATPVWCDEAAESDQAAAPADSAASEQDTAPAETAALVESDVRNYMHHIRMN